MALTCMGESPSSFLKNRGKNFIVIPDPNPEIISAIIVTYGTRLAASELSNTSSAYSEVTVPIAAGMRPASSISPPTDILDSLTLAGLGVTVEVMGRERVWADAEIHL
eukprot:CAMPEP_0184485202 /NCGR_PEP_ID=MMETSP0113_2-20130426/6835_1 /TAXON_ID=91329 /ORGANISM="Norrisiella sphaerica, Strain BC52" /LENGTH=107 /DNA_ID=CAMNT_0026866545 /DNA_START=1030 /DNA_END=1354 /DNA_ORIENTATION=-